MKLLVPFFTRRRHLCLFPLSGNEIIKSILQPTYFEIFLLGNELAKKVQIYTSYHLNLVMHITAHPFHQNFYPMLPRNGSPSSPTSQAGIKSQQLDLVM